MFQDKGGHTLLYSMPLVIERLEKSLQAGRCLRSEALRVTHRLVQGSKGRGGDGQKNEYDQTFEYFTCWKIGPESFCHAYPWLAPRIVLTGAARFLNYEIISWLISFQQALSIYVGLWRYT